MTKRTTGILLITLSGIAVGLFGLYMIAKSFAPGSYPYAETYELNYPETKVKVAINEVKEEHPELNVPKVTVETNGSYELKDHPTDNNLWYVYYFYYPDNNRIVYSWTRPSGKNSTTFAFVSINEGLNIGEWKDINSDFDRLENKRL